LATPASACSHPTVSCMHAATSAKREDLAPRAPRNGTHDDEPEEPTELSARGKETDFPAGAGVMADGDC
jgi:hypothetical protein